MLREKKQSPNQNKLLSRSPASKLCIAHTTSLMMLGQVEHCIIYTALYRTLHFLYVLAPNDKLCIFQNNTVTLLFNISSELKTSRAALMMLRCKPAWTLRCVGVEKQAQQSQEPGVSIFIWKSKQRRWQLIGRWELLVIYHVLLPNRRRKTQKLVSNWRNVATSEFRCPGTMVSCVSKEHMCWTDDEPTVGFMFHFSSSLRQSYDRS